MYSHKIWISKKNGIGSYSKLVCCYRNYLTFSEFERELWPMVRIVTSGLFKGYFADLYLLNKHQWLAYSCGWIEESVHFGV